MFDAVNHISEWPKGTLKPMNISNQTRKEQLETRLIKHGINGYHIKYLPYLDLDESKFATPYAAGSRMMILYAVAYSAQEPVDRTAIQEWLKRENIWEHVSPSEKELFEGEISEEQRLHFLWESESAYILAWALNIFNEIPTPTEPVSEQQYDYFMNKIPALGEPLDGFLNSLSYRNTTEIYDENLFHELATTYFRDLMFNSKEDSSSIDVDVSFQRHRALNWLRRYSDIEEWDETDTST